MTNTFLEQFITQQLHQWPLAARNYAGLDKVAVRTIHVSENEKFHVQYNSKRIISSSAKVDFHTVSNRSCFLCRHNRPPCQQSIAILERYDILVNPYPIFSRHLTIADHDHTPQLINDRLRGMLSLAEEFNDFVIFYNGPNCGASAPDHFHFQAGIKKMMPVVNEFELNDKDRLAKFEGCLVFTMNQLIRKNLVLIGNDPEQLNSCFEKINDILAGHIPSDPEPMLNVLAERKDKGWRVYLFPRKKHRPEQYYASGRDQVLLSPASVDFGGVLITPRLEDYNKLDKDLIRDIFEQVTIDEIQWREIKNEIQWLMK